MEDLKDLYLLSLYAFVRVPEAQIPEDTVDEQFSLCPGGRYYFDLSAMDIPGTANSNLPDSTLHYVPFTYTGTVYAYSLSSNSSGVARSSQAASTAAKQQRTVWLCPRPQPVHCGLRRDP